MKKLFGVILFLAVTVVSLSAQGLARDMDQILEVDAITWAQAARFVLPASGQPAPEGAFAAFELAKSQGWLPRDAEAEGIVDFGGLSFFLMRAFDIPGGLMYRAFPGPRYAYRELVYKDILQGQIDRSWKVSGFWLLTVVGRVLDESGVEG